MKQKLLNSLRLRLCLLVAFVLCAGRNAWGEDLELSFSLTSNPGGWPTSASTTLTNYNYTLNAVNYTFSLNNVYCNSGYLMLKSTAVLGLPAIANYKLTKIVASNSNGCSTSTKVGVSSSSTSASYISGGEIKTWSSTGSTYTYNLSSTAANTVYYLYVTNKNAQVTALTLTYAPTKTPANLSFGIHEGETYTVLPNADFTGPDLSNDNNLTVTYSSSDEDIALVDEDNGDIVIGTKEGTATITASSAETSDFAAGSAKYYIKVQKGTSTVTLNSNALTFNIVDGTTQTLTATAKYNETTLNTPAITWESSNTGVATVDGGVVTPVAHGTTTITASYAGNTIYTSSSMSCEVTVNKANTTLTLNTNKGSIDLKNIGARTFTLTPTVKAIKTDETQVAVVSPTVTWTSSDPTVATVDNNGVVTGLKVGTTTITASYTGGSNYNAAADATCSIEVNDTRDAVNIESFTAANSTIIIGGTPNTTATTVTNNQNGWEEAYYYTSSNTDVATVAANGTVTAVAKGTATITVTLNVDADDSDYKAGTTTSKTLEITVTKPFHNVTFSSNGSTYGTPSSVEEGEDIELPAINPADYNGFTFVGWTATQISGTTDDENEIVFVSSPTMGTNDITYYAVFAEIEDMSYSESEIESEPSQTLRYDTWTYGGSTTSDMNSYRLFGQNSYIESASFDLSLLKKVNVYAGTYGNVSPKTFSIKAGSTTWATSNILSTNSATTQNSITSSVALSGEGSIRIVSNGGTGSSTGLRISKVEIFLKKLTITYSHYCTTVSDLPKPVISLSDVEMTWGDEDKYVEPSATVGGNAYAGEFTYSIDKVGLTVASDGKLSSETPGTYVVTALIEETGSHRSAKETCTVTVLKQDVSLSFPNDNATVRKVIADENFTQSATVTPAAYNGTIAYTKESSSTSASATVDVNTATVTFNATGSVIVKATAPSTDKYNGATATYTLLIQTDPTLVIPATQDIAQGETYTLDVSGFASGDVTLSSSNSAIASIEGLVITGAAVGTATITINTAESDTYKPDSGTFTLNVTAPEGSDSKPDVVPDVVFNESFKNSNGTGGNDTTWSSISGTTTNPVVDNSGWEFTKGYAANECSRFGTGNAQGSATTPPLSLEAGITYTMTFMAGAWNGSSESTSLTLSAINATLDRSSVTMTKGSWTSYTVTITKASSNAKITFAGNSSSNSRFFLDEVHITKPGTDITSTSVTTSGGVATYCYQYPLDLSSLTGAKAYKVSSVDTDNNKVMLEQITGEVKGGVPFILKSDDGSDDSFEITLADESDVVPTGNLLVGTLAPTFVAQTNGDYTNFAYSKSNACFIKLNSNGNTIPANRAYLPINLGDDEDLAKSFILSFDDADGITETMQMGGNNNDAIYNLAGQRLNKPQKGINIINGKKVLVK